MNPLLVGLSVVMFVAGAFQYVSVTRSVEPVLPPQFKENRLAAVALDIYVWSALVPDIARRRYLRSLGFLAIGLAALTLASFLAHNTTGSLLGSAITAAVAWQFATRWLKYRALHAR
jgi:hypothetical protein